MASRSCSTVTRPSCSTSIAPIPTSARMIPSTAAERRENGADAVLAAHSLDAGPGDHARKIMTAYFPSHEHSLPRPRRDRAPDGHSHRSAPAFRSPCGTAPPSAPKRSRARPGARSAPTPAEAVRDADVVITCFSTSRDVQSILDGRRRTARRPEARRDARRLHVGRSRDLARDRRRRSRARRRLPRRARERRRERRGEGNAHRHGRRRRGGARARAPSDRELRAEDRALRSGRRRRRGEGGEPGLSRDSPAVGRRRARDARRRRASIRSSRST